ncbi:MAG TPA: hypothetical protein VGK19_22035 [Capsulimonadaceae bacterium]|jgi:hypothetical protein
MTLDTLRHRSAGPLTLLATVGLAALLASSPTTNKATVASAADNPSVYKTLYTEKCSACHNLPDPTVNQNTRERWRMIVAGMSRRADDKGISITDIDQQHIVDYLSLFPPKSVPGANGPLAAKRDDVWELEPVRSQVFTFTDQAHLASFRPETGRWKVAVADTMCLSATATATDSALLTHVGDTLDGGLDLQAQVRFAGSSPSKAAGLVFGSLKAQAYNAIVLDLSKGEVRLVAVRSGVQTVIATGPLGDLDQAAGWHVVRLMYRPEARRVTVWVDANKKLVAPFPDYVDGGQYGLIALPETAASFRNLYADIYGR